MRAFVFLLVLANLVFFAWAQGDFGRGESPDAARLKRQVAPERLLIVSRGEPPGSAEIDAARSPEKAEKVEASEASDSPDAAAGGATAGPAERPQPASGKPAEKPQPATGKTATAPAAPETTRCIAWPGLSARNAEAVDAVLAGGRFTTLRRVRHRVPEAKSWWVFVPPQASRAEAEQKAAEIRRLGITDYFIVQDAGPNRHAISLGIFSSAQSAEAQLSALRAKGLRDARVDTRVGDGAAVTIEASGPGVLVTAAGDAVRARLPAIRQADCGVD
jgi:hypothetical protein